jgi:hypothetical protein
MLVITQDARLAPGDRSSDRNEQHRAALEHHFANTTQRTPHAHIGPSEQGPARIS